MQKKNIIRVVVIATVVLLAFLVAMRFTDEVNWTLGDFIITGVLLFGAGFMVELAISKAGKYRAIAVAAVVIVFLWLWAELAVGLFTNWGS